MPVAVVVGPAGVLLNTAISTTAGAGEVIELEAGVLLNTVATVVSNNVMCEAGVLLNTALTIIKPVVVELVAGVLLNTALAIAPLFAFEAGVLLNTALSVVTGGVYGQTESTTSFPTSEPNEEDDIPTKWHHG